jgi:hypothetical protein
MVGKYELPILTGRVALKVAVSDSLSDITTIQGFAFPEHAPLQLVKIEQLSVAEAVRVTDASESYVPVPVLPLHVIVPEVGITVPLPVPVVVTVSVY